MDTSGIEKYQSFNSSSKKSGNRGVILMVVLVIIIIAAGLWFYKYQKGAGELKLQEEVKSDVTINQVPTDKAPERFPADIPIEEGAKILQNYNASSPDGRFQATRVFESAKTLDQNLSVYKSAFSKNGWTIKTIITDQPNVRYVSASKEDDSIRGQSTIRENPDTKVITVDISITYLP